MWKRDICHPDLAQSSPEIGVQECILSNGLRRSPGALGGVPTKPKHPTRSAFGETVPLCMDAAGRHVFPLLLGCVSLERHVPLEKFPAVSNVLIHHSPASEDEPSKQDVHSVCDCMSVSEHFSPSHSLLMASTCIASSASVCLGQKHINTMETMCKKASSFFSFFCFGWMGC